MKADHHASSSASNREAGNPLVFVHIPKTAGTTLLQILTHQYSPDAVHKIMMRGMSLRSPRHIIMPASLISFSKIRRLRLALKNEQLRPLIHGHFDLSVSKLLPATADFVTLLRDPVERAISHYYHYRKLATDPVHPLAARSTLAEWISACGLVEMDNGQTRRLAGEMRLPIGEVSSQTLEKAKANLAHQFSVVGLTEQFEAFQVLLHRKFNWPYYRYPARNVGDKHPQRAEMSDSVLRLIRNCNQFDLALYQFASELFEHALGKIDMDRELFLLRAAPEYVEPAHPAPRRSTPGKKAFANIAPGDHLPSSGEGIFQQCP